MMTGSMGATVNTADQKNADLNVHNITELSDDPYNELRVEENKSQSQ